MPDAKDNQKAPKTNVFQKVVAPIKSNLPVIVAFAAGTVTGVALSYFGVVGHGSTDAAPSVETPVPAE